MAHRNFTPTAGIVLALLCALLAVRVELATAQPAAGTGTIRGTVVDARDGTPLRSVSVRLQGGASVLTGDDGRFEITGALAGTQELYVSVVNFILVKRPVTVPAGAVVDITIPITAGTGTYTESLTVRPASSGAATTAPVSEETLASRELQQLRGLITNDPFRAIQVLPGVAAGDDLRSEFTVRGNSTDHMNFTFEGIQAPFLVHTVQGINDSGSVAMSTATSSTTSPCRAASILSDTADRPARSSISGCAKARETAPGAV